MSSVIAIIKAPITFIKSQLGLALRLLPDEPYVRVQYLLKTKRILNLSHPKSFTEKIQWMKVYGGLERYGTYVDKYAVREFVKKTVGAAHLIPVYGVWDRLEDIDFDKLPKRFVLKSTHGYGHNFICQNKSEIDMPALAKLVDKWMHENIYEVGRSPQYKYIKPRLVCEKYMEDDSGALRDYKFSCFGGVPYMCLVIGDRATALTEDIYDMDWNKLFFKEMGFKSAGIMPRPPQFDEMVATAKQLAKDFPFVRVDLYLVDGKVYFGELTFTPANGMLIYKPLNVDYELGQLIDLSKYQNARS